MAEIENLRHDTVMRTEAVCALLAGDAGAGDVFIDATFGGGGHSRLLLEKMPSGCALLALDCDEYAVACAAAVRHPAFAFSRRNYADLAAAMAERGAVSARGVLFDLGASSLQLDSPSRGFSFRAAGGLDMRMDRRAGATAAQWLRENDERVICAVLREYGEEPEARRVARALVSARERLTTTTALADVVCAAKKRRSAPGRHPATRVFQALRIVVNDELARLRDGLEAAKRSLAVGGRLVVIAFHSLEDRLAKRLAVAAAFPGVGRIERGELRQIGRLRRPSAEEIAANPRARSARMRVFVKTTEMAA